MREITKSAWGDKIAPRYDQFYGSHGDVSSMVAFLAEQPAPAELPTLEIGVGTGRVAIELARAADRQVIGADVSSQMLAELERHGEKRVVPLLLDICTDSPPSQVGFGYCVFNTLFMLGNGAAQRDAFLQIRKAMTTGGRLVVEHFQPNTEYFARDSFTSEPLDMSESEVHVAFTRVNAERRTIEGQDVFFTENGTVLAPCVFHYRGVDEVDTDATAAGWRVADRYADWKETTYSPEAENVISVYEAV